MSGAPTLSARLFNWAGAIGIGLFALFAVTGSIPLVIAGSLILGLTNLYDAATRWRDPVGNPRYTNVSIPGTSYRFPPALEIGLEVFSGIAFSAVGLYLMAR